MTSVSEAIQLEREGRIASVVDLARPPRTLQQWCSVRDHELAVRRGFQTAVDAWERNRKRAEWSFYAPLAIVVSCLVMQTLWPDSPVGGSVWLLVTALSLLLPVLFSVLPTCRYPTRPNQLFTEADFQSVQLDSCGDLSFLGDSDAVIANYVRAALGQGRQLLYLELEAIAIRIERQHLRCSLEKAEAAKSVDEVLLRVA